MTHTIRTAAELDALPVGGVVRNLSRGITAERITDESGAIPGSPVRFPWGDLWSAGSYLVVLYDPSAPAPAPSVVPEAAVEAAASAVRKERAFSAAAAFGVPMDAVPQCAEMIARAALAAALPLLTAAPSATRDEMARAVRSVTDHWDEPLDEVHDVPPIADALLARDPQDRDRFWGGAADALLARFTITPKEDR